MPADQPLTRTEMVSLLATFKDEILQKVFERIEAGELRIFERIEAGELRIFERIEAGELKGREHTEHIETRLLTAFHNWATPVNHRLRKLENSDSGVLERLASVEERLTNLELKR